MFFGHTKYLKIWNEYPTQILDSSRLVEVKIRQTKKIKLHVKNVNVYIFFRIFQIVLA